MTAIEIRTYRETDEAEVVALWKQALPTSAPRNEPHRVIREKLRVQRELFFVALRDDAVVGTAMTGYDGRRGWVYAVAVRPDSRRDGVGAALMRRVESELRARGCVKINLQVEGENPGVVPFYEHLGFRVEDRISMGKTLLDESAADAGAG